MRVSRKWIARVAAAPLVAGCSSGELPSGPSATTAGGTPVRVLMLTAMTAANLRDYDVLFFALTSGELDVDAAQKTAILEFVDRGQAPLSWRTRRTRRSLGCPPNLKAPHGSGTLAADMKRLFSGVMAIGVVLLATSTLSAQDGRGAGPANPTNLQVLPKDMGGPQVAQIMQGFAAALGVQCGYCHVTATGPGTMNDFASDMKPQKKTARVMMLMARDVNTKLGMDLGKPASEVTPVQCVTCHRGLPIPKVPIDSAQPAPAPAAP